MRIRQHPFAALAALAVLLFIWSPLLVVAVNSLNADRSLGTWGGLTSLWYGQALADEAVREGFRSTLLVAALSTALSLVVAVSGALWWRRASPMARRIFDLSTYLRILLPEVVFATAIFLLFSQVNFPLGTVAVVVGHTVWNSAYATVIIQARLSGMDPILEEAAADLGATSWRVFRRVTVPALLPGIVAAGLLVFTFSFDDVVTSFFLAGTTATTLPIVLFGLIRFRVTPEINAIGVLVMLFTVSLVAGALVFLAQTGRRGRRLPTLEALGSAE